MASRTTRRVLALLCLAAILLLAFAQVDHGLPVAILAPFWIVLAIVLPVAIRPEEPGESGYAAPFLSLLPSRGPPAR